MNPLDRPKSELDNIASALRKVSTELGDNGGVAGNLISAVAERVESAGRSLEGRAFGDVLDDVENFARRNPATFISGAIAVGFLATRFLKSSSSAVPPKSDTAMALPAASDMGAANEVGVGTGYGNEYPMAGGTMASAMDRPLVAGIAAVAVGAIVGAIIRETDREHELFGNARDRLAQKATAAAKQKVADTVSTVASQIGNRE
jgi:hypothetical protein